MTVQRKRETSKINKMILITEMGGRQRRASWYMCGLCDHIDRHMYDSNLLATF